MPIDPQTWRELFEAVYEMNSAQGQADFGTAVVAGMRKLITADVAVFQMLDRTAHRIMTRYSPHDPYTPEETAYYVAHSGQHPLVAYYAQGADPKARRLSDVIDQASWVESDFYRQCQQRLQFLHCLALPLEINESTVAALSFSRRDPDFTERDCELLDAFAPHFRQSWERHENPWAEQRQLTARRRFEGFGLSPRGSEVLYWMTEGKQNREIATILGIQLGTVQKYVAGILDKLGQENRHAATVFALQRRR